MVLYTGLCLNFKPAPSQPSSPMLGSLTCFSSVFSDFSSLRRLALAFSISAPDLGVPFHSTWLPTPKQVGKKTLKGRSQATENMGRWGIFLTSKSAGTRFSWDFSRPFHWRRAFHCREQGLAKISTSVIEKKTSPMEFIFSILFFTWMNPNEFTSNREKADVWPLD